MSTWRTVAILAVTASVAGAQARLMGTVRDSAGAVISGAEVRVERARPATSGRNGEFRLEGIKAGPVVLTVRRVGYAPYRETVIAYDGDNQLGSIVLRQLTTELDTVAVREQLILREYPLLREFEENRKLGLGQFVTRQELANIQGGFVNQIFSARRGMLLVRSGQQTSKLWIANSRVRSTGRTELEDWIHGSFTPRGVPFIETITPPGADTTYCFPQVYLDYTRISTDNTAPNLARFSPDQLEAIEMYLGPSETPARYMGNRSACGVIVLHSRKPDPLRRRAIASFPTDERTRSPGFASVSLSRATTGGACVDCGPGAALDMMAGLTFRDRWVFGGRQASWSATRGGEQEMTIRQAFVEWYPHPEPGRVKWFLNLGGGTTSLSLNTTHGVDHTDSYHATRLWNAAGGTGVDISVFRRFVITPFVSHTRTFKGYSNNRFCVLYIAKNGSVARTCVDEPPQPRVFSLTQLGTRFGWR